MFMNEGLGHSAPSSGVIIAFNALNDTNVLQQGVFVLLTLTYLKPRLIYLKGWFDLQIVIAASFF